MTRPPPGEDKPLGIEEVVARAVQNDPTKEPHMPGLAAHFPKIEYHGAATYTVECDCGFKSGKPANYYVVKARWAEHAIEAYEQSRAPAGGNHDQQ